MVLSANKNHFCNFSRNCRISFLSHSAFLFFFSFSRKSLRNKKENFCICQPYSELILIFRSIPPEMAKQMNRTVVDRIQIYKDIHQLIIFMSSDHAAESGKEKEKARPEVQTIIENFFGGRLQITVRCHSCSKDSVREDYFTHLG